MTRHGVRDATDDFATFKSLLCSATDFNLGVAMGSASDAIVIDADPRNGGTESFAKLKSRLGPLPRTLTCESSGGLHLYFRAPTERVKKKVLAPGVDLLAEGCYAVAPPSLHSRGRRYRWAENLGPGDQENTSLPPAWLQYIHATHRLQNEPAAGDPALISEGSRNSELARIAGQLRRAGLSETEMREILRGRNKDLCHPPLEDEEVAQIARSLSGYPVGAEPRDEGQKIAQALLDAEFAGGEWLPLETSDAMVLH
jgi:hypothetical protein